MNKIKQKFLWLYFFVGLEGIAFVEFQNLFVHNATWEYILKYNLPFVTFQNVIFLIVYYFYTVHQLKELLNLNQSKLNTFNKFERTKLFNKLVDFPFKIFKFSVLFMTFLAVMFHIYELVFVIDSVSKDILISIFLSFLREQSLAMILTLTITAFSAKILRPYITKIKFSSLEKIHFSIEKKVYLIFFSLLFIYITDISWLVYKLNGSIVELVLEIGFIIIVLLILSIVTIKLTLIDSLSYIKEIADNLSLLNKNDRHALHSSLPVTSSDEIGYLLGNFNHLQLQIKDLYKEIDEELKIAYNVQKNLLPRISCSFGELVIDGVSKPVKEVGGDFFDIIKINDHKIWIIIGDVSGKGIPAALFMSVMIGLARGKIQREVCSPAQLLNEFNQLLIPMLSEDTYVTVGLGCIDLDKQRLTYASAGHVPPIIKGKDKVSFLEQTSSFPLGIDPFESYANVEINLEQIKSILFFSDGILEQWNKDKQLFGFERLQEYYESNWYKEVDDILNIIDVYSENSPIMDDITAVNVRIV